MTQKRDHNVRSFFQEGLKDDERALAQWLEGYALAPQTKADDALLERIVALAAATPQKRRARFSWKGFFAGWMPDAVAFVAVALLGFWVGNFSTVDYGVATKAASVQQASTDTETYFNRVIFGPSSWKEIIL